METLGKYKSDSEKIAMMSREELERIVGEIASVAHSFERMEANLGSAYFEWFRAYALSPEFRELERKKQNRVFEDYDYGCYAIKTINDLMTEFRLGEG